MEYEILNPQAVPEGLTFFDGKFLKEHCKFLQKRQEKVFIMNFAIYWKMAKTQIARCENRRWKSLLFAGERK